jgi:hypothetical protein
VAFTILTMTETGPKPYLGDHRMIDGVMHVWCGQGWIAECYSDYVVWPIELNPDSLVTMEMDADALESRPPEGLRIKSFNDGVSVRSIPHPVTVKFNKR